MTSIQIFNARPEHEFKRQTAGASGWDLCANYKNEPRILWPNDPRVVPTGIHLAMPLGVEAQVRGRSGLGANGVIAVAGTIDSDYRGEIMVTLINLSSECFNITPGMRIAQLVFAPVIVPSPRNRSAMFVVDRDMSRMSFEFVASLSDLPPSERGTGGFGSTGL